MIVLGLFISNDVLYADSSNGSTSNNSKTFGSPDTVENQIETDRKVVESLFDLNFTESIAEFKQNLNEKYGVSFGFDYSLARKLEKFYKVQVASLAGLFLLITSNSFAESTITTTTTTNADGTITTTEEITTTEDEAMDTRNLVGLAGVTGTIRRSDRRQDRRLEEDLDDTLERRPRVNRR
jgi:hypothetical protein